MDAHFSRNLSCCTMCLRCVFLNENCIDIRHCSNCSWPSTTRTSYFQTFKKIIYSGFLPAFSRKFTYQSLGTIAFKIIQLLIKIRSSSHSTISLVYIKLSFLWCCHCYGCHSSWFPAFNVIWKPSLRTLNNNCLGENLFILDHFYRSHAKYYRGPVYFNHSGIYT